MAQATLDRTELQSGAKGLEEEDFDPVIVGPWMDLWDLEQHERGAPPCGGNRPVSVCDTCDV